MTDQPLFTLFAQCHEETSKLQIEMSKVLVTSKEAKSRLERQLRMPDHAQEELLANATHQFIAVFPLASMLGQNMFSKALAYHSNLTGDPSMHAIFEEVNDEVMEMRRFQPEEES